MARTWVAPWKRGSDSRLAARSARPFQHQPAGLAPSPPTSPSPLELAGWSKDKIQSQVSELLALVGLEARAHAYPSELSGGRRSSAIARALHCPCPAV